MREPRNRVVQVRHFGGPDGLGQIDQLGDGVRDFQVGDRVADMTRPCAGGRRRCRSGAARAQTLAFF
jgi:NADPH:quinone reductase-like Zn-dependent oxidoreductase